MKTSQRFDIDAAYTAIHKNSPIMRNIRSLESLETSAMEI